MIQPPQILIVDDEADIRQLIKDILEDEGYATLTAANAQQVQQIFRKSVPDLVILDIWLEDKDYDGIRVLEWIKTQSPDVPVLMISGHGTIETAVNAIKKGAYDFIEKPFKADRLLLLILRALEASNLRQENRKLRESSATIENFTLTGSSPAIEQVRQIISKVAGTNSRVLISGEQGSGKNIVARMIHNQSQRAQKSFMTLYCAMMNPERIERELFGIEEQGTDGLVIQQGILEKADGGTLVLDEVADMPPETQAKIVRVLQEQRFKRINGTTDIQADIRVITTTNRDLREMVKAGAFREDLYFRLSVVPIHMPPLRERVQDIEPLMNLFITNYIETSGTAARTLSPRVLSVLKAYKWPGNVRQLKNVAEYVLIMGSGSKTIDPESLPPELLGQDEKSDRKTSSLISNEILLQPLKEARNSFERDYLLLQLERFNGNVSQTARFIGMERSALHRKLKGLNCDTEDESEEEALKERTA